MLLSGLALAVSIDLASGIEVLAYFESNASSVGEMFLRPVETFYSRWKPSTVGKQYCGLAILVRISDGIHSSTIEVSA